MMNQWRGACRLAVIVLGFVLGLPDTQAQVRVSNWQTYSSMLNVKSVASDRTGNLWAATSGGVFAYNMQTRAVREFRNINALFGLDITAIAVNATDGTVYAGGFNGALNIYDGRNWSLVPDVLTATLTRKQINDFLFYNDLVFIAGDFGLTVFDPRRRVFTETVQRFAALPPGGAVRQMLIAQNRLWAATENGVVSAPLGLRTYANPAAWTVHPLGALSNNNGNTVALAEHQGSLFVAQERNLWRLRGNSFDSLALSLEENIRGLASVQNQLFIATQNALWNTARQTVNANPMTINALSTVDSAGQRRFVVNTRQGFALWRDAQTPLVQINSPIDNRFRSVAVDTKGRVWCVSGSGNASAIPNDGTATGISMLQDTTWRIFTQQRTAGMPTNGYYQIDAQPNGTVWASSYGSGTLLIEPDMNFRLTVLNTTNGISASAGTEFSVLGQVQTDSRTNTVWFPNFQTGNDQVIVSRTAQGAVRGFTRGSLPEKRYHFMAIDRSGTKWLATWRGTQMLAFNERGTLDNTGDDVWYPVPTTVLNEGQSCIAADADDRLWIGTSRAMYTIVNPGFALTQPAGQSLIIDKPRKLLDQAYNAVAVDALNYKWFGTNSGVLVYDSNRDTIVARFTTDNSPLASNTVLSIAIDNNNGRIYFGTDNGLSVATTLAVRPNTDFSTMRCYPQPFVPSQDNELVIDGLAEGTQVKITTVDGLLIRTFPTGNSRTVVWDGLTDSGQPVQSGVYLIAAYSDTVGANAVIKAMVIQR
ncbi:MAG: hypothetical protein MUF71_13130 [Candidatus Kapabacteria bacterium]|jgi:ligand-binding sensor domain-containing protein|nr:hypothetical protein [Candidatus Kapabacteria bacterium]